MSSRLLTRLLTRLPLCVLLLAPAVASADSQGTAGRIASVSINAAGSDDFAKFRGQVSIRVGSKKVQGMKTADYRFGGSTCPGKDLTDGQIQILMDAMQSRSMVKPRFKNGQGGARCLVGFEVLAGAGGHKNPS